MSVGRRVHVAMALLVGALTWSANAPSLATAVVPTPATLAAPPAHTVVGGVEVPTNISQIVTLGAMAADPAGNVYFAHMTTGGGLRIYKAAPAGGLTVYAGNGTVPTVTGDGSLAISVGISSASALATDNAGNLFFFDGSRIRKVTAATGKISTIAGDGTEAAGPGAGDGSVATSVGIAPYIDQIVVDSAGNVFYN